MRARPSRVEHAVIVEAEILAFSVAWDAALVANDADAVAGFMADEWVYVGETGATPKVDLIGWIAAGRLMHDSMRMVNQPRIAVYGDTAMLTCRKASTGSWDGTFYAADEWISEVYVRRHTRWQCVLSHKSSASGEVTSERQMPGGLPRGTQ
ncbi:MAG: nuclear transport factor 2 family protein [Candidatus Limnocylindrales bacterium]